jgi:cytochrome b subunit of formate dehydrogenase
VHDIAAVVFLTAVLAHFYLAVLINPESLRSVFGGRVSLSWARVHHPDWKIDEYSPMSEEK